MSRLLLLLSLGISLQGCTILSAESDNALAQLIKQDLVLVEGGRFTMGVNCNDASVAAKEAECPAHEVSVNGFYISKFELTQGIFNQVLERNISYFQGDNMPVNNISWQQVHYFIAQLNEQTGLTFRLPTEAEWEFAANGGNLSQGYRYSGSDDLDKVAWHADNANNKARAVGLKQPNELGLYDMTGNVGEMTEDGYDSNYYKRSASVNPVNAIDSNHHLAYKSIRGGSFAYASDESENFRRDSASQSAIMPDIGFRLVLDVQ